MPMTPLLPARDMFLLFFFNDTTTTEIYTLSLHDALPILNSSSLPSSRKFCGASRVTVTCRTREARSEEHTSELQSLRHLVCRLLLEKKKLIHKRTTITSSDTSARLMTGIESALECLRSPY